MSVGKVFNSYQADWDAESAIKKGFWKCSLGHDSWFRYTFFEENPLQKMCTQFLNSFYLEPFLRFNQYCFSFEFKKARLQTIYSTKIVFELAMSKSVTNNIHTKIRFFFYPDLRSDKTKSSHDNWEMESRQTIGSLKKQYVPITFD